MEPATTTQALTFPKRPQLSKNFQGRKIALISNHFTVTLAAKQPFIYLYQMTITESGTQNVIAADARKLRGSILRAADNKDTSKKLLKDVFGENWWASGQMLWSNKNHTTTQHLKAKVGSQEYDLEFVKTKEVSLRSDTFQSNETAASARQYVNVIIKRHFRQKNYVEWGMNSKFYDGNNSHKIPEYYLDIYTGFKTSCEIYQNYVPKILIDFASRIVRSDSALYYINQTQTTQQAREMLIGRSVIASYGNYRMWRVDEVDFRSNPTQTFEQGQGQPRITFIDYYKKRYGLTIQNTSQPLLINIDRRTGRETVLIPELVQMTGLDEEMKSDFNCMKKVAEFTRLEPQQRMQRIKGEAADLKTFCKDRYEITMEQQSSVNGYLMNPPQLTIGGTSFVPDRGNYQLRDPVFKPATFDNWLFVYSDACKQDATVFIETLKKCAGAFAIKVRDPIRSEIRSKKPDDLKEDIRKKLKTDTQIVVCMYPPGAKKHWYKALKDVCYKEKGVPCQAVVNSSLKKNAMSVCSKILLQMNAKIGLELWVTQKPAGLPDKTMIIGADVYHKTKVGEELKSCVGFCASLNPDFSKFFSKVSFQKRLGEEIMVSIGKLVKEAVLKYFAFNGKKFLPECIIFFRDGLADNQLNLALEVETRSILNQLKSIDPNYDPKFAEIVVTKRIDDRIFATEGPQRGGRGGGEAKSIFNPPAGTVAAETIVSNNFDYLLVSQNVTQGTCTPTRFNVIYDTTGLPQDVFWQLSYWQSYNYFNWNGSVRVPAPVQYAHKLAYLVGQTVQGDPDKKLDESLYYL